MSEDFAQRQPQAVELGTRKAVGATPRANACMKQAFVGVDVADAGEQRLVEQGCFDGQAPSAEEGRELALANGERLIAGRAKRRIAIEIAEFEPPETPRIDEAQLAATLKREPRMGVRGNGEIGCCNQQPSGHAEVRDPWRVRPERFALVRVRPERFALVRVRPERFALRAGRGAEQAELKDNVLAGAMNGQNGAA